MQYLTGQSIHIVSILFFLLNSQDTTIANIHIHTYSRHQDQGIPVPLSSHYCLLCNLLVNISTISSILLALAVNHLKYSVKLSN
jgi:hypothetical protein